MLHASLCDLSKVRADLNFLIDRWCEQDADAETHAGSSPATDRGNISPPGGGVEKAGVMEPREAGAAGDEAGGAGSGGIMESSTAAEAPTGTAVDIEAWKSASLKRTV